MILPGLELGADDLANFVSSHTQSGRSRTFPPKVTQNSLLNDVSSSSVSSGRRRGSRDLNPRIRGGNRIVAVTEFAVHPPHMIRGPL
jgi:hypothetical protein